MVLFGPGVNVVIIINVSAGIKLCNIVPQYLLIIVIIYSKDIL